LGFDFGIVGVLFCIRSSLLASLDTSSDVEHMESRTFWRCSSVAEFIASWRSLDNAITTPEVCCILERVENGPEGKIEDENISYLC
jgi:hypothetical protein